MGPAQANGRPLPLAGVRVLDVSQVMAGPFACIAHRNGDRNMPVGGAVM